MHWLSKIVYKLFHFRRKKSYRERILEQHPVAYYFFD